MLVLVLLSVESCRHQPTHFLPDGNHRRLWMVSTGVPHFNGHFRILNWRYCTIYKAIFSGDILLHRPYIGLIYGTVPPI